MKHTLKTVGLVLLALSIIATASAAEVPGAGTTPMDGGAWQVEVAWENVRTAFTFAPEAKASYLLERAEERSLELEEIELNAESDLDENEQRAVGLLLEQHERHVERARTQSQRTQDADVARRIESRVESVGDTHIEVLKSLRDRLPEEAHEGIDTAIERSQARTERANQNVEDINRNGSIPEGIGIPEGAGR